MISLSGHFGPACRFITKDLNGQLLSKGWRGNHVTVAASNSSMLGSHNSSVAVHTNVLTPGQLVRLHVRQIHQHKVSIRPRSLLGSNGSLAVGGHREMSSLVRIVGGLTRFLKIRYLVLFGGAGGGYAASQQIEKIKVTSLMWNG
ncbi:hypothetical protein PoB_006293300 [Plakobranchus ocellatus]|uniref:Uncharacterized protein n=1 Tax=Plakobranchus ocellatus TaxID=259542 RepID=A0AAV4CX41_9GAST|nr:hypothetical protein PoB_006293300 [Plakobranchus ocellatus]